MQKRMAALYVRVSTEDQAELSPDAQKRLLLEYAKKNNLITCEEFIFCESVSGRHAQKRPEFQKMIAMAKQSSHPFDVILVWKFSRFARNQEESIVYKSMLKKDDVEVISISEPLVDGPFGSLIERIIEWMDEYYSIRLSGEVKRGMKEKALRHGYQSTPPLGYKAVGGGKPFVIDEASYAIVSYAMNLYDCENMDETAIARKCNDLGYRTKRGNLFERRSIDRILRNPFYCGTVTWNGMEFEGSHEVRISKERFQERQKLIQARMRPAKSRSVSTCRHWLSGLLKCSICGATLAYTGGGKDGYHYFNCWQYAKGYHRGTSSIPVKKAEEAVIEYFDKILEGADFSYVRKSNYSVNNEVTVDQIHKELSRIDMKSKRIHDAYESGIDSLQEYKENKERLNDDRSKLEFELHNLLHKKKEKFTDKSEVLKEIKSVNDVLKDPDVGYEEKGMLIRTIVDQIVWNKENNKMYFDIIVH